MTQYEISVGDCLELLPMMKPHSVDMVLCDLPYGTTRNKWDSVLPLEELWLEYWRVVKPDGAIVLTAQAPFDKILGASEIRFLKYEWIWQKGKATGHLNAKKQPMKAHENILVFYRSQCTYNPQMRQGEPYKAGRGKSNDKNYGSYGRERNDSPDGRRYPRSVLDFPGVSTPQHPTQKPLALMEYLIRTYTNEGETVLDNTMGSGTTGVACVNSRRNFVGFEKDESYFLIASDRIREAYKLSSLTGVGL